MGIKEEFYRIRLFWLMYGFAWVIRLAGMINRDFRSRLMETPFAFVMKVKESGPARYFQCLNGKLRSSRQPLSQPARTPGLKEFGLVWRDSQSGGQAMINMLLGKPKALYRAVEDGVLLLEGDAKMVFWFLKTVNQLNRVFRPARRSRGRKT